MSQKSLFSAATLALVLLTSVASAQPTTKNVYVQHNLVSDIPGNADVTDPNLVDPWGVSETATSPFWVSNHNKGNTTLYNGAGAITALVVTIPPGAGNPSPSTPTGQVPGNGASWLLPAPNGKAASFIFATEDGTISAWNSGAGTTAVKIVDNSAASAVYKGLAVNPTGATPMLYAANFFSGNIDVFDASFNPVTAAGGFTDPNLPAGFAPFNIWNLGGKLYVTYAKQAAGKKLDAAGAGNGLVNIYDTNGNLLQRLISNGGALNSPWGITIAPAGWGAFGGDVLVGNFGDGKINAFDPKTGALIGTLQDASGNAIVNTGLWALLFGNGKSGGDTSTLYLTAGITGTDGNVHGLLAAIAPPSQITQISNAASFVSGSIAPGEIVLLNGFTIGPSPLAASTIPATGAVGTTAGATSVTVNGTPAPILYSSASATSVAIPYEVSGATANVVVTYKNNASATFTAQVASSAPGLFTTSETGTGQVVAINGDNSINSSTNAAAAGTAVLLYATGEGATNPPGQDGAITSEFFHEPVLPVTLTIGGKSATVVFAGSVPGLVAGVMEVEAIIPAGAGTGAVAVVLTVGSASTSQQTATISLK